MLPSLPFKFYVVTKTALEQNRAGFTVRVIFSRPWRFGSQHLYFETLSFHPNGERTRANARHVALGTFRRPGCFRLNTLHK